MTKEQKKIVDRNYYLRNKERMNERSKQYYKDHPEWAQAVRKKSNARNKESINAAAKAKRQELYQWLDHVKITAGCKDCGYNKYPESLDFDHLRDKVSDISRMVLRCAHKDEIEKELVKCEVVCANCHRHRTRLRRVHESA